MSEPVKPSTEQAPEGATATAPEPPSDFREYVKWRESGESAGEATETSPAVTEETPKAQSAPQSGAEANTAAEDEDDEESDKSGRGGARSRKISRLKAENDLLKQQIASMQPRPAVPEAAKPAEPPGKPKLHDYPTLEAYQEALTDWKLDQREAQKRAEAQFAEAKSAQEKLQADWTTSEETARTGHADYDDIIQSVKAPEGPGVQAARQALLEEPNGAEILYYLGTHPDELERIAKLQPVSAIREIGRLSATLAPPSAAGNPKPKVSGAPKPPAPLSRPSAGSSKKDINDEEFARNDFRGWSKAREAQLKGR